jgi:hypothetical protein
MQLTYNLCNSWYWFYKSRSAGTNTKGKCAMVSNEVEQTSDQADDLLIDIFLRQAIGKEHHFLLKSFFCNF